MKLLNYSVLYVNRVLKVIANLSLAGILLVISAGIVSRYVFDRPFDWTEEVATLLMVCLAFFSAAIVTVAKKHIVADFLIAKAPKVFTKIMSVFSRLLEILFLGVVFFSVYKLLPQLVYRTPALHIPRQVFYYPVISMAAFMCFAVIVDLLNDLFPGYELASIEELRLAELERKAEEKESEEMAERMESFVQKASDGEDQK